MLPYVQMHEFEGLLFSDVSVFPFVLDDRWSEELQKALEAVAAAFETPEDINNGVETAPSKRLMKLIPAYDKILDGGPLAKYIGFRSGTLWGDRAEPGAISAVPADVKDSCRLRYGQLLYAKDESMAR